MFSSISNCMPKNSNQKNSVQKTAITSSFFKVLSNKGFGNSFYKALF